MNSNDEFTGLFTTYFGDKLSPVQIEGLAADVMAAQADRRARLGEHSHTADPQPHLGRPDES